MVNIRTTNYFIFISLYQLIAKVATNCIHSVCMFLRNMTTVTPTKMESLFSYPLNLHCRQWDGRNNCTRRDLKSGCPLGIVPLLLFGTVRPLHVNKPKLAWRMMRCGPVPIEEPANWQVCEWGHWPPADQESVGKTTWFQSRALKLSPVQHANPQYQELANERLLFQAS